MGSGSYDAVDTIRKAFTAHATLAQHNRVHERVLGSGHGSKSSGLLKWYLRSLKAWRARDSNTLWHITAVIVRGQGAVVGVYEHVPVGWPQCANLKTTGRREGRRVGDTASL